MKDVPTRAYKESGFFGMEARECSSCGLTPGKEWEVLLLPLSRAWPRCREKAKCKVNVMAPCQIITAPRAVLRNRCPEKGSVPSLFLVGLSLIRNIKKLSALGWMEHLQGRKKEEGLVGDKHVGFVLWKLARLT